jgi:hypothetical protein
MKVVLAENLSVVREIAAVPQVIVSTTRSCTMPITAVNRTASVSMRVIRAKVHRE